MLIPDEGEKLESTFMVRRNEKNPGTSWLSSGSLKSKKGEAAENEHIKQGRAKLRKKAGGAGAAEPAIATLLLMLSYAVLPP